jgi:hypothetical protein
MVVCLKDNDLLKLRTKKCYINEDINKLISLDFLFLQMMQVQCSFQPQKSFQLSYFI